MKFLYSLLLAATVGSGPALAQTTAPAAAERPHMLDFGIGQSLNGSGDFYCLKTHLGYTYTLGRHLSVGPRLAMISGADVIYFDRNAYVPVSYHAVNLEGEAYYAPFGNDRRFVFALGAGAYVGHTKQYDVLWASYGIDNIADPEPRLRYEPRNTKGVHVGYLASLNADLAVDQQRRWQLGLKVALQNDTYANILPGVQLRVGRRL
ncbi:hypothetical protein EJV47_20710 [Hymenobacter gummosus]|uniref:Outer membrane protein beta-barrel domain-containing protein n=1 Tax=Hymenobacter gummosus TaxID=1776032 RepID=A0A431TYH8_9BACT|nr:hypothetical protein [Hymenobacter gummosus]RTQ46798.1 hypothetical protein EJV47_20710 [Hymenobacter gummosus]